MNTAAQLYDVDQTGALVPRDLGDNAYELLEASLREYLNACSMMRRQMMAIGRSHGEPVDMLLHSCCEELPAIHGVVRRSVITECTLPPMPRGNCFANSFEIALTRPDLKYTEGWALMEHSLPTHHAWLEDAAGRVYDPTWLDVINHSEPGEVRSPNNKHRAVYCGVSVPMSQHLGWFRVKHTMNLLSYAEMTEPEVLVYGIKAFAEYEINDDQVPAANDLVLRVIRESSAWVLVDRVKGIFERDGKRWANGRYL